MYIKNPIYFKMRPLLLSQTLFFLKIKSKRFYSLKRRKIQTSKTSKKLLAFLTWISGKNFMQVLFVIFVFVISLNGLAESQNSFDQDNLSNQKSQKTVLIAENNSSKELMSKGQVGIKRSRVSKKKQSIQAQYEECKGKDIYKLNSQFQELSHEEELEASILCIDCLSKSSTPNDSLNDTKRYLQRRGLKSSTANKKDKKKSAYKSFKEKLRKKVMGQVKLKMAQNEVLQICMDKNRNKGKGEEWLAKRAPRLDWSDIKEGCDQTKEELFSSVRKGWYEMRVNLAMASVDSTRIVTGIFPNLSSPLSHEVSDFGSLSKLKKGEKRALKKRWLNHLSKAPLEKVSVKQLESHFFNGGISKKASSKDLREMVKATKDLQRRSRDDYHQIVNRMPLLAYMKTGEPENEKDMAQAFSKYNAHLEDLLEKVEDENVNMSLLLSFEPLVKSLLKGNEGYCLVAEGARLKAERDESLKKWGLMAAGVVAGGFCIMTSGMSCLGLGLFVGATGLKTKKGVSKESLERFLTGKDFETLARLEEKDREAFWELVLLPTALWGTVAGTVKTVKGLKNIPKKLKTKSQKKIEVQKDVRTIIPKTQINPEDVRIAKTGYNADTKSDIFQVKFKSSNNKEVEFDLEISKERLEQNKLDIEEEIKNVVEFEGLDAKEAAEYAAFAREKNDLLLNARKLVSSLSEESIQKGDKISLEELEAMAIRQYKNRIFQHVVQNYSQHHNSKLSHIGVKNVHIKKTGHDDSFTEYEVQFKTQKGKKRSLKLKISKEADGEVRSDDLVLDLIKEDEIDFQVLTMQQKIQLAIGQMPAEIFKGLKSITIRHNPDKKPGDYAGRVFPDSPGMLLSGVSGEKIKHKYALKGLPSHLAVRFPIDESVVHTWMRVTKSTKSHMELVAGRLDDIPFSSEHDLAATLAHELGHVLQNTRYSIPTVSKVKSTADTLEQLERMKNPKNWPKAIKKDGTSVSDYGDKNLSEDFAEAMRVYIQTDGGTKDPQALRDFANRFEILDNLMEASMTERKSLFDKFKKAMEKKGVAFVTRAGALTHIVIQNRVYIIPPDEELSEPTE